MLPSACVELRTYSSRYFCSCCNCFSSSATLCAASAMGRLKSLAEEEAISWMGSNLFDFIMGSALSAYRRCGRRELCHELLQIRVTSLYPGGLVHVLAQKI